MPQCEGVYLAVQTRAAEGDNPISPFTLLLELESQLGRTTPRARAGRYRGLWLTYQP